MRSDNSGCYQTQGVKSEKERNAFDLLHPALNIFSFSFFFFACLQLTVKLFRCVNL